MDKQLLIARARIAGVIQTDRYNYGEFKKIIDSIERLYLDFRNEAIIDAAKIAMDLESDGSSKISSAILALKKTQI